MIHIINMTIHNKSTHLEETRTNERASGKEGGREREGVGGVRGRGFGGGKERGEERQRGRK